MMGPSRRTFLIIWMLLLFLSVSVDRAVGKDALTPDPPPTNATTEQSEADNADASPPAVKIEEKQQIEETPNQPETTEPTTEKTEFDFTKTPKVLHKKLFFSTGFYLSNTSGEGNWVGSGMSDFSIGYNLPLNLPMHLITYTGLRFAPIYLQGDKDSYDYKGVAESYGVNGGVKYPINPKVSINTDLELAFVNVDLDGGADNIDAPIGSGVNFGIGLGSHYWANEFVGFGAKINASFGVITIVQLGLSTIFYL